MYLLISQSNYLPIETSSTASHDGSHAEIQSQHNKSSPGSRSTHILLANQSQSDHANTEITTPFTSLLSIERTFVSISRGVTFVRIMDIVFCFLILTLMDGLNRGVEVTFGHFILWFVNRLQSIDEFEISLKNRSRRFGFPFTFPDRVILFLGQSTTTHKLDIS
jgi:hypothetical protein